VTVKWLTGSYDFELMLFIKGWFVHIRSAHILRKSHVMKQIMVMFTTYR